MRKLYFYFLAVALFSCSSDSDGTLFDSRIQINGVTFSPDEDVEVPNNKVTVNHIAGDVTVRGFSLMRTNSNGSIELLQLGFIHASSQSIDGVYTFEPYVVGDNHYVTGTYLNSEAGFEFKTGSIFIKDLRQSRYQVSFSNGMARDYNNSFEPKVFNGSCTGFFLAQEPVVID
jgi:hypothetical protein